MLVAAMFAIVGNSQPVSACSCVGFTDAAAFDRADVVFTAALVDVVTPQADVYVSTDADRFLFAVDRVYKGEALGEQGVLTPQGGESCGLEISGPGPFVVFATLDGDLTAPGDDADLSANLCGGTRPVDPGGVPDRFGPGKHPSAGASTATPAESPSQANDASPSRLAPAENDDSDGSNSTPMVVGIVAAALALVAVLGLSWVRRSETDSTG